MRINTNVSALTALSNLNKVQDAIGSSMQKLSSGFRINKAGDDAAGLGISNQMGADIKAMTQASRNAEQAGSVLQIMDGATSNIQTILERMKELAAQSASDTVDAGARGGIDSEFGTLTSELDRIVSTTKFQGASLLDGTFGSDVTTAGTVNATSSLTKSANVSSVAVASASTFKTITSAITASVVKTGNTLSTGITGAAGATVAVVGQSTVNSLTTAPVAVASALTTSAIVTSGGSYAVDGVNVTSIATDNSAGGSGSLVAGDTYHFTAVAGAGTTTDIQLMDGATNIGSVQNVAQNAASFSVNGLTINLKGTLNQAATIAALNTKSFIVNQNYNVTLSGGGVASPQVTSFTDDGSSHTLNFGTFGASIALTTGSANSVNGKTLGVTEADSLKLDATGTGGAVTQSIAISGGTQAMSFTNFGLTVNLGASSSAASLKTDVSGGLNSIIQDGARKAQFLVSSSQNYGTSDLITLDAINLSGTTLGVDRAHVDLTTATGAQAALATIDTAIGRVGTAIGAIGASENRVMYADNNVKTAIQNFTAAQSAIKDVDMASEMTTFSKNQILSQASTAMLAQANQLGQSVLKLLQ
jgi:flagellin